MKSIEKTCALLVGTSTAPGVCVRNRLIGGTEARKVIATAVRCKESSDLQRVKRVNVTYLRSAISDLRYGRVKVVIEKIRELNYD